MALKYKNVPTWLNIKTGDIAFKPPKITVELSSWIRFDSKIECKVYQIIRRYFPEEWVFIKPKLVLKTQSHYSAAVKYIPDFLITNPDLELPLTIESVTNRACDYRFIEVKGIMIPASKLKLAMMELVLPHQRNNLLLVSHHPTFYQGERYEPSIDCDKLAVLLERLVTTIKVQNKVTDGTNRR